MGADQHWVMTGSERVHATPGLYLARQTVPADAVTSALRELSPGRSIRLLEGDLLTRAELPDWLHALSAAGYRAIAVETSAWLLAKPGVAEGLKESGLTHVLVPMFGASQEAHDWVVGSEGAMARTLRGVRGARKAGLHVRVIAPVLRPTFRDLSALVRRCLAVGASGFDVVMPCGPEREAHGLHPHPALAAPYVAQMIRVAQAANRRVTTRGLPLCLLGEHADFALERQGLPKPVEVAGPAWPTKELGVACSGCAWTATCGGLYDGLASERAWAGVSPVG